MVGIVDIVAILFCGEGPLAGEIVFLGKFALSEGRVGITLEQLIEFGDCVFGRYIIVGVGIFDIAFGIVLVKGDGLLIFGGGAVVVF